MLIYSFVRQETENDCSIAIVAMLIEHFQNQKISIEFLKFKFNLDDSKKNINDINFLLEKHGIKIKTYESQIEDLILVLNTGPVIALVNNSKGEKHFVLVYKKIGQHFLVADPNDFKMKYVEIKQFIKTYLQIVSIPKKVGRIPKNEFTFWSNFKILKSNIFFILFIALFGMICDFLVILSNTFIKNFLVLVETNLKSEIISFFIGFAIIFIVFLSLSFCQTILIRNIFLKICQREKIKTLESFFNLNYEHFKSISHVKWYQIFAEIHIKNEIIIIKFFKYFNSLVIMIVCLVLLEKINIYFFTFVLIENFIIFFLERVSHLSKKNLHYKIKNSEIKYQNDLKGVVDGFLVTKTRFNTKKQIQKVYKSYNENTINNKKIGAIVSYIEAASYLLNKFFYLVIFYFATFLITNKQLEANELIYYSVLTLHIKNFFTSIHSFIDDTLKLTIINQNLEFLNLKIKVKKKTKNLPEKIAKISVQDVSKFSNSQMIIKNLTADFSGHTFLTGRNGAGKTSLLLTIAGIYDNFIGKIKYDDIDHFELTGFESICYLGNNDFIENTSVKEFLTANWAIKPEYSLAIEEMLDIFNSSKINLELLIKDNGANLSLGQKQIINFASIIFTNFEVYLIDESLSNVEAELKVKLIELFLKIHSDKIVVFCDHEKTYQNYFNRTVEI